MAPQRTLFRNSCARARVLTRALCKRAGAVFIAPRPEKRLYNRASDLVRAGPGARDREKHEKRLGMPSPRAPRGRERARRVLGFSLSTLRAIYIRLVTETTEGRTDGIYPAEMRETERKRKRGEEKRENRGPEASQRRRTGPGCFTAAGS